MTVKQLLIWCLEAYNKHDDSYSDVQNKHLICKKQALLDTVPKQSTHGYGYLEGELDLAVDLMFANSYQELAELEEACYSCEPEMPCDPSPPIRESVSQIANEMFRAPTTMAEVRERIEEHNQQILSQSAMDEVVREVEAELLGNPPPVMSTAEMGRYMAEVLSRPVPPECVIPMDLRISTESRP